MGRRQQGLERVDLGAFDKGFFYEKDFEEVPDGGSTDCKHVIWYRSALRKMFGMDRINSTQVASGARGNGVFYLDVLNASSRAAVFADKFYEDVSGTWTDRTGAAVITDGADNLWQFVNYEQGANRYLVGANGVDTLITWTGSGNISTLATPQVFSSIALYRTMLFGVYEQNVYHSDVGDITTYDANKWVWPFNKEVKAVAKLGEYVAVLKEDSIGSLSGYSFLDLVQEEEEVSIAGASGRLAVTEARFGAQQGITVGGARQIGFGGIACVNKSGVWFVDEAFNAIKLFGDDYFSTVDKSNMHKAWVAYSSVEHLLYVGLPIDTTEVDTLLVIDMATGAVWPHTSIHGNSIRSAHEARDDNGNSFIYFVDANGYAFKFNPATNNYHDGATTEAINARFKTKKYDFKDVVQVRSPLLLASEEGDWAVTISIAFGLTQDDGTSGSVSLKQTGDALDTTFILGASLLGGSSYVLNQATGSAPFGRFMTMTITNANKDEPFNIRKAELLVKRRRMGIDDQ